ncbi:MAG: hypothetical protein DGJ47_000232 [Rickettsiaceae bacterium]
MVFKGIITALVTPFSNNKIDFESLSKIIKKQIDGGIKSIVIGGSTGEGSSLSEEEYYALIQHSVQSSEGKIKIIAGITGVYTEHVCEKIRKLMELEVDGLMCTVPHYVKPEQSGLLKHFVALNDASEVPIMIYAHPGRTGCNINDKTLVELSNLSNITALKDATSDIERPLRLGALVKKDFRFLVGDDAMLLAYGANGGEGCVSVTSNVMPKAMNKIYNLIYKGKNSDARQLLQRMLPIIQAVSCESNPIGIKYVANMLQLVSDEIRLPLTHAGEETVAKVNEIIPLLNEVENECRL